MNQDRPSRRLGALGLLAGFVVLTAAGCCKKNLGMDDEPSADGGAALGTGAETDASGSTPNEDPGPLITVPAGTLVAGTPCQKTPRITNEELEGVSLAMAGFTIDAYPYPNDPAQTPKTGVARDEAASLCRARGRRLCTELEWERACKGPSNTMYPYGDAFRTKGCEGSSTLLRAAGSYEACQSAFGVKAVYGAVWEWTASDWGRGGAGGLATVRGGGHANPAIRTRCANGQSRSPSDSSADLGFRCCGGPVNPASVDLQLDNRPALVADPSVDPALESRLLAALPTSMRNVQGFITGIDRVWRWHPRANEEMILARYRARRAAGVGFFYHPVVFHLCGNSTVRSSKLRGPVAVMREPTVGSNAGSVTIPVETGSDKGDVTFTYYYGNVSLKQPTWIKQGDSLDTGGNVRLPGVRLRLPGRK